jgi:hypothetical protein
MPDVCAACGEVAPDQTIRTPQDLWSLVEALRSNLGAGVLRENPLWPLNKPRRDKRPFVELRQEEPWPDDYLEYHFVCTSCGDRFRLAVETYHGSGGKWIRLGRDGAG